MVDAVLFINIIIALIFGVYTVSSTKKKRRIENFLMSILFWLMSISVLYFRG